MKGNSFDISVRGNRFDISVTVTRNTDSGEKLNDKLVVFKANCLMIGEE